MEMDYWYVFDPREDKGYLFRTPYKVIAKMFTAICPDYDYGTAEDCFPMERIEQ